MRVLLPRVRLIVAPVVSALAVLAFSAGTAGAADSLAPPGASDSWLPAETWVGEHWLPYDEKQMLTLIDSSPEEMHAWLVKLGTLEGLARSKGKSPSRVITALMARWKGRVSSSHLRELRSRARRTFTQSHLAAHMFYHGFHDDDLNHALPRILGISSFGDISKGWAAGRSMLDLGRRNGRQLPQIRRGVLATLRASQMRGVRGRWTPLSNARRWLVRPLEREVNGWLSWAPKRASAASSGASRRASRWCATQEHIRRVEP